MEYFRLKGGEKVPAIGLGTWTIGGGMEPDTSMDDFYVKSLRKAFELGYRLIDTAEAYGGGHCEELVGKALEGYDRDEFFIVTKVWPTNLEYERVIRSLNASLSRLRLKYVDLYLIHWPNPSVPIKETIRAMEKLIDEGKTRYIGVSNFSLRELEEAIYSTSKHEIVVDQVKYSVFDRRVEKDLLPYAIKNGIIIMAYTPLERGRVNHRVLAEIGSRYGKTAAQVALNYLISNQALPIPKAVKEEHQRENLGALGWRLSSDDIETIRRSVS